MDAEYEPAEMETRTLFGLEMQQKRNDAVIDKSVFTNVVTKRQQVGSAFLLSELLVGWLCFTSHRQRGHLETAHLLSLAKDVKLGFYTVPTGN